MDKRRPLGVKIIAGILFLDALILFSSATASVLLPHQAVTQIEQFFYGIPYFRQLPIGDGMGLVVLDLMLGAWAAWKGLAIWFMKSWARILIIIDLAGRFGSFFSFAVFLDRKWLDSSLGNPDFVIGFVINLAVLIYLADSGVEQAFDNRRP